MVLIGVLMPNNLLWKLTLEMIEWVKACAEEVFEEMGPGHSEALYEACMALELGFDPYIVTTRQVPCPLTYKGYTVAVGFIDILVKDLVVELKATITKLTNKDEQQVRKYLTALGKDKGLLINFGTELEIMEVQRNEDHGKTGQWD